MAARARSPAEVTYATWKALFLREAIRRLSTGRAAWFWVLLEPMTHILFMLFLFATVRMRVIGGIDTMTWVMVGLLAFFMFRRTATQTMAAISANQALFTYRQVKPVDTALVRGGLEGFLMILVSITLFAGAWLFGHHVLPADPLAVLEAILGLWLLGLGFGLITSVLSELQTELGKIIDILMIPLQVMSGAIFPLASLPEPYRGWLMLNPVPHGLEAVRSGFAPFYQTMPETSMLYMYGCALVLIFTGLVLQARFADRMVMR